MIVTYIITVGRRVIDMLIPLCQRLFSPSSPNSLSSTLRGEGIQALVAHNANRRTEARLGRSESYERELSLITMRLTKES